MIAHITWFAQLPANISHWIKVSLMGPVISPQVLKRKQKMKVEMGVGEFSGGGKGEREEGRRGREGEGRRGVKEEEDDQKEEEE